MKKKGWIILAVITALLIAAALFLVGGLYEGQNAQLHGINLTEKPDGDYTGTCRLKRWTNTVQVHVQDHAMIGIDIVKDMKVSIPQCSEEMFSRVIEAQDTRVDVVSGATVTSKAYLKAIEDAMNR